MWHQPDICDALTHSNIVSYHLSCMRHTLSYQSLSFCIHTTNTIWNANLSKVRENKFILHYFINVPITKQRSTTKTTFALFYLIRHNTNVAQTNQFSTHLMHSCIMMMNYHTVTTRVSRCSDCHRSQSPNYCSQYYSFNL